MGRSWASVRWRRSRLCAKRGSTSTVACGECEMVSDCLCYTVLTISQSIYLQLFASRKHAQHRTSLLPSLSCYQLALPASKLSVPDKPLKRGSQVDPTPCLLGFSLCPLTNLPTQGLHHLNLAPGVASARRQTSQIPPLKRPGTESCHFRPAPRHPTPSGTKGHENGLESCYEDCCSRHLAVDGIDRSTTITASTKSRDPTSERSEPQPFPLHFTNLSNNPATRNPNPDIF